MVSSAKSSYIKRERKSLAVFTPPLRLGRQGTNSSSKRWIAMGSEKINYSGGAI
jgi:hypothetical protein